MTRSLCGLCLLTILSLCPSSARGQSPEEQAAANEAVEGAIKAQEKALPAEAAPAEEVPPAEAEDVVETEAEDVVETEALDDSPPARPAGRALSWDATVGRVPAEGALIEASLGFSGLPRLSYTQTMGPGVALGGLIGLDYGRWMLGPTPELSAIFAGVGRVELYRGTRLGVGARGEAGLRVRSGSDLAMRGLFSLNLGYTLPSRAVLGIGLDLPIELGTRHKAYASFGALFGPTAELHLVPDFAVTGTVKIGPIADGLEGAQFGLRAELGLAYRL